MARLPELAATRGVQKGTLWTVEVSGEGWGVAEGPMDSKHGRAMCVLRILCVEPPAHHLAERGPHR